MAVSKSLCRPRSLKFCTPLCCAISGVKSEECGVPEENRVLSPSQISNDGNHFGFLMQAEEHERKVLGGDGERGLKGTLGYPCIQVF